MVILNQYKNIINDFINSFDLKYLIQIELIDEKSRNDPKFEGNSADLSNGDFLHKDVLNKSSQLAPKTENLQIRSYYIIVS